MNAVEIEQLTKVFAAPGGEIRAVDDISLNIERGELFGLFGSNGAGKSTLVRMLSTLLLPTSGRAFVGGYDVVEQPLAVRSCIGLVTAEERSFYGRLSARQNLAFFAAMQNVPRRRIASRVDEVLRLFDIGHKADSNVQSLSTGQRQRLNIARALVHDPAIIFFDEPTKSMDVRTGDIVKSLIREQLVEVEKKTVVYISHELYEMDNFCDRVVILSDGRVQALGTPTALGERLPRRALYRVVIEGDDTQIAERWRRLAAVAAVEAVSQGMTLSTYHVELVDEATEGWLCVLQTIADCGGRLESYDRVDDASLRRIVSHFTKVASKQ